MIKIYRPITSVLIKPAGPDCNMNCRYCFYLRKSELFPAKQKHRMSPEVQEEVIRQIMEQSGQEVVIAWQGGEPTLMGLDFYKRAVKLETKYGLGKMVGNGLQTNGLLLNEEWADFLRHCRWLVGLSLDGPEHIHDHYRLNLKGKGTHAKIESIANMLIRKGVETNALCCVTDYSSQYPEELYRYFKELGLTFMQFIPVVETDPDDPTRAAYYSITAQDYGNFLVTLFDLWISDFQDNRPITSIRHFESVFFGYVNKVPPDCSMQETCGHYVVIEHNGNVYSCDFFVEPKWMLGNIQDDQIIEMLNSEKQRTFRLQKADLPADCRQCPWLHYCFGGCIKDRIKDPQDQNRPRFCESFKQFFNHADPVLRQLAEQWKRSNG
ncbi:anaerobic sulfatase maturase [bacterium]|nr:anaerobic sulfatase maturase [bacterium]